MRWILFLSFMCAFTSTVQAAPEGWQEIKTGGNTLCARGAEYSFLYHAGDPNKVLVSFGQGGACWDAASCDSGMLYKDTVTSNMDDVAAKGGVYDITNPQNPYYGWSQVMIPYCTADVHLGNGDAVYSSGGQNFTIHHRGAINTRAVMAWMQTQYPTMQNLVVSGCSAGSYGSIVWAPTFAEMYKTARVTQYGDSGAGVADKLFFPQWKIEDSLAKWVPGLDPATIDWNKLSIVDVYKNTANYYPQIQFSQFNHSHDTVQTFFYSLLGGNGSWSKQMFKIMDDTSAGAANFKYFVADSSKHCSMIRDRMYSESEDGVILADWLKHATNGDPVDSVHCKSCSRLDEPAAGPKGGSHGPLEVPEELITGKAL